MRRNRENEEIEGSIFTFIVYWKFIQFPMFPKT